MTKLFQDYKRAAVEFVKAEGNYLFDQDGKKYLDFSIEIGVTNLGFHPEVKAALQRQSKKIRRTPNLYLNSLQEEVAGRLIGGKDCLIFFASNGAEANEATTRITRKATGKQRIITFVNSFHDHTFGSISATGQDQVKDGFGDVIPHFSYAIYNDLDGVKNLVTDDTATIMLELVQGESGVRPANKDLVTALSVFCQETGILLIADEVQTSMGHTGRLFSFEHCGIEPDIFTLAKGLGNGVPVGAILAKGKIGFAFSYGNHGSTSSSNKLVMSTTSSVLDIVLTDGFLLQAFGNGNHLQAGLERVLAGNAKMTDAHGLGYMIGIETTKDFAELVEKARDRDLIVLTAGASVTRPLSPLALTEERIDQGVAILAEVFA